ncbi:MAG: TfuA-related McrA-glycine thioamidation protein [Methanocorpusculum sp.]|nr:TfuA-related McrA-glycine thioamidation protein [Methanocorpusculum sp.]
MQNVVVYIGPSLDLKSAKEILPDAEYLPPVKRGDVSAAAAGAKILVIIDGVFFQNEAVAHREILQAMKSGVKVFGSSSMGALRASELDTLGMIGVGKIYEQYKSGEIIADDEVGLVYDKETGVSLSDPMVNIRASFSKAVTCGVIDSEEEASLIKTCKSIYYPDRTYKKVVKDSNLPDEKKSALLSWLKTNSVDQKKLDAVLCLETVKDFI